MCSIRVYFYLKALLLKMPAPQSFINSKKKTKILYWHFKFHVFIFGFEIIYLCINCIKSGPWYNMYINQQDAQNSCD